MANPRQEDKSTQAAEDAIRRTTEKAAEETRRVGETAAQAGEEIARVGAKLFQQNTETLQNTWRFGLDMATTMVGRSTEQLGRTLGLSGNDAQRTAEQSARNAENILYSTTAASKGMSMMSQEYFELARHQIEKNIDRMNELWRCRTPHEVAVVQSEVVRETVESMLESSRRMADLSIKLADDTAKHVTQNIERMQRAA
ncbi:MAG: phasin family protein [Bradyrhizobium sp.]|uniref:phasin family protein n=1 Tax=Bradyrhizobium sp. TaxID=376 RepID=UPI0025C023AC|nr:phasin family protein [Bradyrhizobium sp.]MBI5260458.1 phasin family protein [Bradyrhizobium sp.]